MEVSSEKSKKKAAGLESSESETLNKSSENTFASASASALDGDPFESNHSSSSPSSSNLHDDDLGSKQFQSAEKASDGVTEIETRPGGAMGSPLGFAGQQSTEDATTRALLRLVGRSRQMAHVHHLIRKVALCDTTILIEGETGTGKELVAKAVHELGGRRGSRFLAHNCGATPDTLIESELFGHVKGAFTGAVQDKKGLFEVADGGTFFLDEIADISPMMQIKLLRVLQEREFRRVGETQARRIDVRIIAATNRDLLKEVEEGRFRRDLYYRLGVIKLRLPPLRERREDIEPLVEHFLGVQARRFGVRRIVLCGESLDVLTNYDWPGNVRELENEIERAVALNHPATEVSPWAFSETVRSNISAVVCDRARAGTLKYETDCLERKKILETLELCTWNKTRAAGILGLSRQGLLKKMRRFKLMRDPGESLKK